MGDPTLTTGLPGLDQVLKGLLPGDNVVWQVDGDEEYRTVAEPFARAAVANGKTLIYFRFARHEPLLPPNSGAIVRELNPEEGFENFVAAIHSAIATAGRGAFYVFDNLSRLAVDWYSDQMLANFFMLTCPYLYDMEAVAYFALYRNYHTANALDPIRQTAQLFLDTYRHKGNFYLRPVKVQQRYSPTMGMLHLWREDGFHPVTASVVIAEILTSARWSGLSADSSEGFWESNFIRARELLRTGEYRPDIPGRGKETYEQLVRMIISRDASMQRLLARYMTLQDILDVRKRLIGTGLIGGKAVGMLLARAILKRTEPRFTRVLEEHDSFFVGSDVFYDFLVRNGIWWVRQKQRDPATFLEGAEQARRRMLTGEFPGHVLRQLEEMLDYFGQSPFIVRSSSLLEDNYGNSFAGKYESVFCVNQGSREQRLQDLLAAIRTVYASSMSERALTYRARRGMLDRDEQMALLIMRVSGQMIGRRFYPHVAGVAYSFNPYAWDSVIDPRAGVVRLVFGLGTRAVNRTDDDFTRIIALNAPDRRPETSFDDISRCAQRRVDYLDLDANQHVSGYFTDLVPDIPADLLRRCTTPPPEDAMSLPVLTFDPLVRNAQFIRDLREMLGILQTAYEHPVDVEFTANFLENGEYRINLLQCRPLQFRGTDIFRLPAVEVSPENILLGGRAAIVGQSRFEQIGRIVYVAPDQYVTLPWSDRHALARFLGQVNRLPPPSSGQVLFIGPGRWGTTHPSLGIPVTFGEINRAAVLCELTTLPEAIASDVSVGTHFFSEMVESDQLYVAIAPGRNDVLWRKDFFEQSPNALSRLLPNASKWENVVRVLEADEVSPQAPIRLWADAVEQRLRCYIAR